MKAICCRKIGFTLGLSAIHPKNIFPSPAVTAIQVNKLAPLLSGKISLTYATMWTYGTKYPSIAMGAATVQITYFVFLQLSVLTKLENMFSQNDLFLFCE